MSEEGARWLRWGREIHALAQAGYQYAQNSFERDRANRLMEIAAEIIAAHSQMQSDEVLVAFSAQPGYVTPKVDVRAAVFQGDELLMVREAIDGGWTLPGGWADVGEPPRKAIEREVLEETGLEVSATRLVGIYDANRVEEALHLFHAYKLLFLCEYLMGDPVISDETSDVGFFSLNDLPQPLSPYRTTPRLIEDSVAAYRTPTCSTVFD